MFTDINPLLIYESFLDQLVDLRNLSIFIKLRPLDIFKE